MHNGLSSFEGSMSKRKHLGGVFWEREEHETLVLFTTNKLHRTILTNFYIFTQEKNA